MCRQDEGAVSGHGGVPGGIVGLQAWGWELRPDPIRPPLATLPVREFMHRPLVYMYVCVCRYLILTQGYALLLICV